MPYDKSLPYACPCCGYWNGDMKYDYYKHLKPLIKDAECRGIMRLWAGRCGVETVVLFGLEFRCGGRSISFGADFGLEHLRAYTIDELCGEEEE